MNKNEIELRFQQFLPAHTSPATPSYAEAEQWQREGWTWERVVAEWHVGADLLWAAEWMGLIDADTARGCACDCVDRCACLAPDVTAVSDTVKRGDMVEARHEVYGIEAITGRKEIEMPTDGKEPVIPVAEDVEIHGASKARYAAGLLTTSPAWTVMSHAVQSHVFRARGAWVEAAKEHAACEDPREAIKLAAVAQELYAAIPRVEAMEAKAHVDAVRAMLGGLK